MQIKMHILSILTLLVLAATTGSYAKLIFNYPGPSKRINFDSDSLQNLDPFNMPHNDNYDMIMPDYYDHAPSSSIQYQNFDKFYDPEMPGEKEYKMDETQYVLSNPVRTPQPLTFEERHARLKLEDFKGDSERQRWKLKKGNTPFKEGDNIEHFDYDMYVNIDPSEKESKTQTQRG